MRIKQDLGITEEDRDIIKTLCALKETGSLLMYETITVDKEKDSQSVTQVDLFTDKCSVTAKVDCIGMEIEAPIETKKKKE